MSDSGRPSQEVRAFAAVARQFCGWLDGAPKEPDVESHRALAATTALLDAAIRLPFNLPPPELRSHPKDNRERWKRAHGRCAALPFQYYSEVFDPFADPPEEPVCGDVADDLADIYRDVRAGLDLFDAGRHEAALGHWSFHFACHWGEHATSAIRALYWSIRKSKHA